MDLPEGKRPTVTPIGSLLYAQEVPPAGGDTGFSNMYRAFETLPAELKRAIVGKSCKHDSSRNSVGDLRKGFKDVTDPRDALFLGRRRNAYIVGLPLDEGEDLLKQLWARAGKPELAWYQKWKAGDLVMWDNRCAMHRTQIRGDRPFFDPATLVS